MKTTLSLAFTLAELAVVFYGCNTNHAGASNLIYYFTGCNVLGFVCALLCYKDIKAQAETRPQWALALLNFLDACMLGTLVYHGWWRCALGYTLGLIASLAIRVPREAAKTAGRRVRRRRDG